MREIKFRAWDQRYKTWHLWGLNVNPETGAYFTGPPHNELIHCQFTGLHDKNGKEIYEGDIVQQYPDSKWSLQYTIKWREDHCGYWMYISGNKPNITLANYREELKVIGNIYENPELLEEKK